MKIERYITGPLQENAYVLLDETTGKWAAVDPGYPEKALLEAVSRLGAENLEVILLTHGHVDHIGAVRQLQQISGAPVAAHEKECELLSSSELNLSAMLHQPMQIDQVAMRLRGGDKLSVGSVQIEVLATPGHTEGGVCYLAEDVLFSGDTLFAGSIGRTDFPGGSHTVLMQSIASLLQLPEATRVLPGHGEATTLLEEHRQNPYITKSKMSPAP